jgi:hypothetical protein
MRLVMTIARGTFLAALMLAGLTASSSAAIVSSSAPAVHTATRPHAHHRPHSRHHARHVVTHAAFEAADHSLPESMPVPLPRRGDHHPARQRATIPVIVHATRLPDGFRTRNRDAQVIAVSGLVHSITIFAFEAARDERSHQATIPLFVGRGPPRAGPFQRSSFLIRARRGRNLPSAPALLPDITERFASSSSGSLALAPARLLDCSPVSFITRSEFSFAPAPARSRAKAARSFTPSPGGFTS